MVAASSPVAGLVSALQDTILMQGSCVFCSPFSSCVPPASKPALVWAPESCHLQGPSAVAAALMGSNAVSSKGAPVGLACWKVTLARPPRLLCFHPRERGLQ